MGMKFSSIVDRHVTREETKRIQVSEKKGKKYSWIQIDPFAFLTRTSRGKNWLAFLYGAVETINTSRLIIG